MRSPKLRALKNMSETEICKDSAPGGEHSPSPHRVHVRPRVVLEDRCADTIASTGLCQIMRRSFRALACGGATIDVLGTPRNYERLPKTLVESVAMSERMMNNTCRL